MMSLLMTMRGLAMASIVVVVLIYCILRVFYSFWWKPKWIERQLKQQGIKGTPYKFFYGDLNQVKKSFAEAKSKPMNLNHKIGPRVSPFVHHTVQTYGKISVMWIGKNPRIIVADPELMRSILMDKDGHFRKQRLNPLVGILARGVSTLNGEKGIKRRKLINPAFRHDKIQGMVPAFTVSCSNLIKKWEMLLNDSQSESIELDIAAEFQNLSGDVIARSAFGSSYEEGKRIFELQKEQILLILEAALSIYVPGFEYIPTKKNKRRYAINKEVNAILMSMIEKKETAMRNGESTSDDLLGLLLQIKDEANNDITIEDVIEECKLFYFAGQETTANLLAWTLVVLSMHPEWQEKAREEVVRLCGKKTPDLDAINKLKIVSMILHEVLRLYPPATALFRVTNKQTKIGDKSVPGGAEILLPTLLLQHDVEYWGEDAEEFKPERFAQGISKAAGMDDDDHVARAAFYPFGWGPRICLGQSFAMVEAKLALAMVLQNFWFELSPSYAHAPCTVITLQPQHGAPIILHKI